MRIDIKRLLEKSSFSEDEKRLYFDTKQDRFLHNIDTLYYSFVFKNDNNENEKLNGLFETLKMLKVDKKNGIDNVSNFFGLDISLGSFAMVYNFKLQDLDNFDIFIADYLPNRQTPRVLVQLRSNALWVNGVDCVLHESFLKVRDIFLSVGLEIDKITENRIDYAFHTNSIQNPYKFFSDERLNKHLKTTLTKYYKIGDIDNNGFTLDYFALGKLKSNNVFNRNYNKVREVIELGYKAFFFEIWLKNNMISEYDKFCMEYAYIHKSFNALDKGRLYFYLKYGHDEDIKREINHLLEKDSSRHCDFVEFADKILPSVTTILNVEFQTKRKFYYYADENIYILPMRIRSEHYPDLRRIYKIIDNRRLFIEYLTRVTVKYINGYDSDNNPIYMAWWLKLRNYKYTDSIFGDKVYSRIYNNNLDLQKKLKDTVNSIATHGLYLDNKDKFFKEDLQDLLSCLNDNTNFFNENYSKYKQKKYKTLKNKIPQSVQRPTK